MHDLQLLLGYHRHEACTHQRAAERERSAKLAKQAARMERWANRSERLSKHLADMAKTRRLLAQ